MTVLKILGFILATLAVIGFCASIVIYSNRHTQKKFNHSFFSIGAIVVIGISLLFGYFGFNWYEASLKDGTDTLNGLVLMIIGCAIALALIIYNWVCTNFVYGFFGSVLQLGLLAPVVAFGIGTLITCLVLYVIIKIISDIGVQKVRIVK